MNNLKLHSTILSILFIILISSINFIINHNLKAEIIIILITFLSISFFKFNWIFFQKKSDYYYSSIFINIFNSLIIFLFINNLNQTIISFIINLIATFLLYIIYRSLFIHNKLKTILISNNPNTINQLNQYKLLFNITQVLNYEQFSKQYPIEDILNHSKLNYGIPKNQEFQHIIIDQLSPAQITSILNFGYISNIDITLIPTINDILYQATNTYYLIDKPFYYYQYRNNQLFDLIRRLSDIILSLIGIIISSPIMLITAILIKLEDFKSPILYTQQRIGIHGKSFKIYKFRSMIKDAEKNGIQLSTKNDNRVTKIGSFIRKTRIDELPQLINILKGDMSIVGPRPERDELIKEYLKNYPDFNYRLKTKPGLSGLAQIEGKYNTNPQDKTLFDVIYTNNKNYLLDLNLIIRTIKVLFLKESTEGLDNKDQFNKDKNSI